MNKFRKLSHLLLVTLLTIITSATVTFAQERVPQPPVPLREGKRL